MKSNHEGHEAYNDKKENVPLWFLRELRALRGDSAIALSALEVDIISGGVKLKPLN
jgi:hypothetical protein